MKCCLRRQGREDDDMGTKKTDTRFSIAFNQTDPEHRKAADLLNKQGYRSKADYIAHAVLHYENCAARNEVIHQPLLDEGVIESVVNRLLHNREKHDTAGDPSAVRALGDDDMPEFAKEINFDEAMEVLGEEGLDAVLGSLDMFRSK